jgi:hypothetical protein
VAAEAVGGAVALDSQEAGSDFPEEEEAAGTLAVEVAAGTRAEAEAVVIREDRMAAALRRPVP